MRHIYADDEDESRGPIVISDDAESLVDTIASALMRGDTAYAYLRAQRAIDKADLDGQATAKKRARDYAEEENRRDAEFGHGKVEFRTRDGLKAIDKLELCRDGYYQPVWKRACRARERGFEPITSEMALHEPIPVRTYEFRGEITRGGLPVYEEIP